MTAITLHPIGAKVIIQHAGPTHNGRTGVVVGGSVWTHNVSEGNDPGDRTILMDDTGEHLVYDAMFIRTRTTEIATVAVMRVFADGSAHNQLWSNGIALGKGVTTQYREGENIDARISEVERTVMSLGFVFSLEDTRNWDADNPATWVSIDADGTE